MSEYDFKIGDIVRFEDTIEYNYTTGIKKTVARIVDGKEYSKYDPYYEEKDDECLVQIIAMEDLEEYNSLSKESYHATFPVKKSRMLHYKGEYDHIVNVKILLLQKGYGKDTIKKLNKRKKYNINSVLLEGF